MRNKVITAVLLFACGIIFGFFAWQNIMWAVWGKQNAWYEYVGLWGCLLLTGCGIVTLKNLKIGTYGGLIGIILLFFYFLPALLATFLEVKNRSFEVELVELIMVVFFITLPTLTLAVLIGNICSLRRA